ncbi:MAG: hypothetical protein KDA84_18410, partial [Planctomycetaceae bacterium]|nr:hypothetical protein [Planctomycetaceae bacterium]
EANDVGIQRENATSPSLEMQRHVGNRMKITGKRRTLFKRGSRKKVRTFEGDGGVIVGQYPIGLIWYEKSHSQR